MHAPCPRGLRHGSPSLPAQPKSDLSDFGHLILECRTRVNPSSGGTAPRTSVCSDQHCAGAFAHPTHDPNRSESASASAAADPPRTSATSAASTAPVASAASAAASASAAALTAAGMLLAEPGRSGVLLVEDIERPQADVGDFLLIEGELVTRCPSCDGISGSRNQRQPRMRRPLATKTHRRLPAPVRLPSDAFASKRASYGA